MNSATHSASSSAGCGPSGDLISLNAIYQRSFSLVEVQADMADPWCGGACGSPDRGRISRRKQATRE